METKMTILSPSVSEFYNKCHDENGRFCDDGSSGPDEKWASQSEAGKRRFSDLKAGKKFKPVPKARIGDGLDDSEEWPEEWIDEKKRKSGEFAVTTYRGGERKVQKPLPYDEAVRTHNLLEITRTRNGKKEYLSPEADHLTARMKSIGLDKVISPKELSRMVREEKPIWVRESDTNSWRYYKVPKSSEEFAVAVSKTGTIGSVIPGGYLTMAINEAGPDQAGQGQLSRLLMKDRISQQYPSDETATPTLKINPVTIGNTVIKRGR